MVFVDREGELRVWQARLDEGVPHLALLYGRRRLGKTVLLRRLLEANGGLYFQVPDQAGPGILRHLNDRLREQTGRPLQYATLRDFLFDLGNHGHRFIVLDEAQRLLDAVDGAAGLLQEAWDLRLKAQNVVLALCGSVIGTLEALLDQKSPLYGRITHNHHLGPFTYGAVRGFYPGLDEQQRLQRYAVLGATPHYHDINLSRRRISDVIRASFLDPGAPLRDEPRALFAIEFQKPERYQEILEAMGLGARTLGEVAGRYGRQATDYTAYFQTLRDRLRIVANADPIGGKRKRQRIGFTDPFFRFYYGHIYPRMDRIELGDPSVLRDIEAALPSLVGKAWEEVCRQWLATRNGTHHRGLPIRFHQLGAWWDGEEELDVVALGDDAAYLGECKHTAKPVPKAVVERLEHRAKRFQAATNIPVAHLFLWTRSPLEPAARRHAEDAKVHVLHLEDVVRELS